MEILFKKNLKALYLTAGFSSTNENHLVRDRCTWKTTLWLGHVMTAKPWRRSCSLRNHHCKWRILTILLYFCLTFYLDWILLLKAVKFSTLLFYLPVLMGLNKRNKLATSPTFANLTLFSLQFTNSDGIIRMVQIFLLLPPFKIIHQRGAYIFTDKCFHILWIPRVE